MLKRITEHPVLVNVSENAIDFLKKNVLDKQTNPEHFEITLTGSKLFIKEDV
jgi:hypothetical protein